MTAAIGSSPLSNNATTSFHFQSLSLVGLEQSQSIMFELEVGTFCGFFLLFCGFQLLTDS